MENHKQWKHEFDLTTKNKSNNKILVPISTGKKTPDKRDEMKHSATCIPSF
jgi:tmRNA-binding protein